MNDDASTPIPPDEDEGMPRWVKSLAVVAAVAAVAFVVLALAGGHRPGRHSASPSSVGADAGASSAFVSAR